jgi:hypothetical protein
MGTNSANTPGGTPAPEGTEAMVTFLSNWKVAIITHSARVNKQVRLPWLNIVFFTYRHCTAC